MLFMILAIIFIAQDVYRDTHYTKEQQRIFDEIAAVNRHKKE